MEGKVFKQALDFYGITEQQLTGQLSGGTYNAVHEFEQDGEQFVIRIGDLEFDIETTNAMIEWLQYLQTNEVAVAKLVRSIHNHPVEYIQTGDRTYSVDVTYKILGENARTQVRKARDLSWAGAFGQAVGKMHELAKVRVPENVLRVRPHWNRIGNDFCPPMQLSPEETGVLRRRTEVLKQIQALPKTPDVYGLIHVDLHLGNILVHEGSSAVSILDFDDVSFGWFMMDLVTPITDMWVCYPGPNKEEIVNQYLAEALAGYQLETQLKPEQQAHLPLLLDLLEIGVYTRFHQNKTLQQENGWVRTFMTDRKERIEASIPFVNLQWG
jgi:amicoumacin kinase